MVRFGGLGVGGLTTAVSTVRAALTFGLKGAALRPPLGSGDPGSPELFLAFEGGDPLLAPLALARVSSWVGVLNIVLLGGRRLSNNIVKVVKE